jgi:hypothetical protein
MVMAVDIGFLSGMDGMERQIKDYAGKTRAWPMK